MRWLVLLALTAFACLSGCTYECNASNCADGCCGADGVCYLNGGDAYCGLGGAACQDCGAEQSVCNAGTCGVACVPQGSHCEQSSDCCSQHICWPHSEPGMGECSTCRGSGESCFFNEDCCGYPARHCERPDGINFICR